jgi:predicted aspartyl protease
MRILSFLVAAVSFAVLCRTQTFAGTYNPTPLTAAQILAKADQARGKRDSGSYVEVRTEHLREGERRITTLIDGDDWRTTVDAGNFTYASGVYKGRSWSSNANGIVTVNSNFRSTSDPNVLALEHPDDPNAQVTVLGITPTEPQEYVIDVNPPGGIDVHRYYDAKTFLLDRVVRFERDRYQHVTEYSDYREFFGAMVPGQVHSYDGRPENDVVTTLISFEQAGTIPDLRIPDSTPLFSLDGSAPVVLPAQFTNDGIIIQAKIGDRGYDFILDSGTAGLTIDPRFAAELGLTAHDRMVRIPQMSIGPLQMHNVAFDAVPFSAQARGYRVVGLIGFDFLASAITEIDFKAKTLTLYPRSAFAASMAGQRALPLQLDDGLPRTKASVEGVPGNFLVDTGSFMMVAYKDYVAKLPSTPRDPYTTDVDTVGGPLGTMVLHLSDFAFGGILFRSVDVLEPTGSTFDILDYDGIIGRDALKAYKVTFDYADGILFLHDNI